MKNQNLYKILGLSNEHRLLEGTERSDRFIIMLLIPFNEIIGKFLVS